MKNLLPFLLTVMLFVMSVNSYSQSINLMKAQELTQAAKYDSALVFVELAAINEETSKELFTWYLRGFILKELYKAKENSDPRSKLREESFKSCVKSLELDKGSEIRMNTIQTLKYLASRYKNDAAGALNSSGDYETGIYNYEMYKKAFSYVDPSMNFNQQDVEFNVVLGDVYGSIFEKDMEKNKEFFELSKKMYEKALVLNPNDASANYHLAKLYYNKALNIIKQTDYDMELIAFDNIVDESVELFKISLPYMEKAHELDPKNVNTLEGLSGIYYSLQDKEKYEKFSEERKKAEQGK